MMLIKKTAALILCILLVFSYSVLVSAEGPYVIDGNSYYLAGDVNGDKTVDIFDYVEAKNGTGTLDALDLNGSGEVDSYDYALLRAMILGVDKSLWS